MATKQGAIAHLTGTTRGLTSSAALDVAIVDGSGNHITSFGGGSGGTSSTDESAFTAGSGFGTPAMGIFETVPTTLASGQVGLIGLTNDRKVKISGSFSAAPTTASTSTISSVAESASSVTGLASNSSRLAAILMNDSGSACYIKYGATASASSHTDRLLSRQTHVVIGNYTGRIDVIWDSTPGTLNAALLVTELTA